MNPLKLVATTIDRLKKTLYLRIFAEMNADVAESVAARQATLELRADQYDQSGHHAAASRLRTAAAQLGGVTALDSLDAELDRMMKPDVLTGLALPESSNAIVPAPADLAAEPSPVSGQEPAIRGGPGRPRKLTAESLATTRRSNGQP